MASCASVISAFSPTGPKSTPYPNAVNCWDSIPLCRPSLTAQPGICCWSSPASILPAALPESWGHWSSWLNCPSPTRGIPHEKRLCFSKITGITGAAAPGCALPSLRSSLQAVITIPDLVRRPPPTVLPPPRLNRRYLPAPPPPFYNTHSKELKSAQRFSPTRFIQTALEFNCCRRTSYPGSLDKTLYVSRALSTGVCYTLCGYGVSEV